MKSIIIATAILFCVSCSKSNEKKMEELKSDPEAVVSGLTITLKAGKSQGDVRMFGWSVSPAAGLRWNTATYYVDQDFKEAQVTVPSKGKYVATLIVYSHTNVSQLPGGGPSNSASLEIDVK